MKSRRQYFVPGLTAVMLGVVLISPVWASNRTVSNEETIQHYQNPGSLRGRVVPGVAVNSLIADYTFNEGGGLVVHDVSGVEPVMHLAISNSNQDAVTWLDGALVIDGRRTLLWSEDKKIYDTCIETQEITISAWLKPAGLCMSGPTRAVTFSKDTSARNFTLGTDNMNWVMRLRTTETSGNGMPDLTSRTLETRLQHVVYTRHSSGEEFLYVNGIEKSSGDRAGTFTNWDASHVFALGNEINPADDRQFFGAYYRVSIYSKALAESEVGALYARGHAQIIPEPAIRANGRRQELTVGSREPVTITATMAAGIYAGWEVDWFVIAVPHGGANWYYRAPDMQWPAFPANALDMCMPVHRGGLMNIYNPVKLLDRYPNLTPGTYDFYLVVDYPMNGRLDMLSDYHVYDMVRIVVD